MGSHGIHRKSTKCTLSRVHILLAPSHRLSGGMCVGRKRGWLGRWELLHNRDSAWTKCIPVGMFCYGDASFSVVDHPILTLLRVRSAERVLRMLVSALRAAPRRSYHVWSVQRAKLVCFVVGVCFSFHFPSAGFFTPPLFVLNSSCFKPHLHGLGINFGISLLCDCFEGQDGVYSLLYFAFSALYTGSLHFSFMKLILWA